MSIDESDEAQEKFARPDDLEKVRNEEYKIWKKQSPFLYDICISKAMPSPSASVQWYPAGDIWTTPTSSPAFETYSLLLSSSELLGGENTVFRATCDLPLRDAAPEEISAYSRTHRGVHIVDPSVPLSVGSHNFPYTARYSSVNPHLVAVCGRAGFVKTFKDDNLLFDLAHHTNDVYDLSWSPHREPELVTVSADGTAALWDITRPDAPTQVFVGSNVAGYAESASQALYVTQFAPLNENELVTAGDGRTIQFWDLRQPLTAPSRVITDAHATGITALDYSPSNKMLLATGSADGAVSVWDVRMNSASLMGLNADAGPINSLKWSPHEESVFATGGADAQVKVWDLSMHGQAQTAAEEEEGPPELIFIHGGHLGAISDLSWHPVLPWTLCSVSEDSLVGIWKIASSVVDAVDNEDPDEMENDDTNNEEDE